MNDTAEQRVEQNPTALRDLMRMAEALLFAATEPLDEKTLAARLPRGADIPLVLECLQRDYAVRGVNLVRVGDRWRFRTADDLAFLLQRDQTDERRLSRAALETLAIIAYHQPVTRAEIEEIRGVSARLDALMETGWVRMRGRRRTPGRPVTYGTTPEFLDHFGLESLRDLPGLDELKGSGLLNLTLPPGFSVPQPDDSELGPDEDPLDPDDLGEETEGDLDAEFAFAEAAGEGRG
ncbi:MAG: SMC-Scp complex subunit ScpB [Flavobacteriaceae bacterium]